MWRGWVAAVLYAGLLAAGVGGGAGGGAVAAEWVGARLCAECHEQPARAWERSDHARSMQVAGAETVLGDFNDAQFTRQGVTTRFLRRGEDFVIRTQDAAGMEAETEFPVRYTFGYAPLQQYLLDAPGGRLQAFWLAWDARPRAQGGQRWFDLYPGQAIAGGDPLHWTGRDQNWNFMCADCHSTNLRKNYDTAGDRFATTWSDLNVACEACHGPGSEHVAWARGGAGRVPSAGTKGLVVNLAGRRETEVCFGCHSRRQALGAAPVPGQPFLDNYLPALLEPGLYFPDGQIDGEVFEYGAFSQSRMHGAGVTCSNCHDPHTQKLRASGNGLCAQCHRPALYDRIEHVRHAPGSAGAQCVNCHMPPRTYMGVDVRRDHGFRIPRPGRSAREGGPNVCQGCHEGRSAQWVDDALAHWAPDRAAAASAASAPMTLPIVLATAASRMQAPFSPAAIQQLVTAIDDPDPLPRLGAARGLAALSERLRAQLGAALLADPVRAVRVETARALAGVAEESLSAASRESLRGALAELIAAEEAAAERPEARLALAQLYQRLNRFAAAEGELHAALRLDRRFIAAWVNLADLYRVQGRDDLAEHTLLDARQAIPDAASVTYALALLRVRQQRRDEARLLLAESVRLAPRDAATAYAYALALLEAGEAAAARDVVARTRQHVPDDPRLKRLAQRLRREDGAGRLAAPAAGLPASSPRFVQPTE